MKIAVIGGGITGLTAAYELTKYGHTVSVYEKDTVLGGLAHGFTGEGWDWPLEFAYHHFFTNDYSIINLAKELGMANDLIIKRPITATLLPDGSVTQLDSPISLLKFSKIALPDRLRTGMMLAVCKLNPYWKPLENLTAKDFIRKTGGEAGWKTIWEPLLYGKFNEYESKVAASWFWARIYKRTTNLGYFRGGFQHFVETLASAVRSHGGTIKTNSSVSSLKSLKADSILLTAPTPIASVLLRTMNHELRTSHIPHLHAQTLILETDRPILKDVYWLNVNDRTFPFLAAVAHTNFMDPSHYNGHHLTYFGNYLPDNHPYLTMKKEKLLSTFMPFIKRLYSPTNPEPRTLNSFLFTAPFAQPVHELNYSQKAPKMDTGIPGIYLANMDSIYPWDRGTNYAVELGQKAAKRIIQS